MGEDLMKTAYEAYLARLDDTMTTMTEAQHEQLLAICEAIIESDASISCIIIWPDASKPSGASTILFDVKRGSPLRRGGQRDRGASDACPAQCSGSVAASPCRTTLIAANCGRQSILPPQGRTTEHDRL
jgi:hypothetical protein